jgi:hypothetical protein
VSHEDDKTVQERLAARTALLQQPRHHVHELVAHQTAHLTHNH